MISNGPDLYDGLAVASDISPSESNSVYITESPDNESIYFLIYSPGTRYVPHADTQGPQPSQARMEGCGTSAFIMYHTDLYDFLLSTLQFTVMSFTNKKLLIYEREEDMEGGGSISTFEFSQIYTVRTLRPGEHEQVRVKPSDVKKILLVSHIMNPW